MIVLVHDHALFYQSSLSLERIHVEFLLMSVEFLLIEFRSVVQEFLLSLFKFFVLFFSLYEIE